MLDNLRSNSEADLNPQEDPAQAIPELVMVKAKPRRSFDQLTSTTAVQRLILACLLFMTVCLMGFLLLIFTGKIIPYFLY
jgi:hypothetical protein